MSKPSFKLYPLLTFDESLDEFEGLEDGRNHLLYRVFFWIGTAFIGFFALVSLSAGRTGLAVMLGLVLLMVLMVNLFLLRTNNLRLAGYCYTAALIPLAWFLVWHGGVDQTGPLWIFPLTVIIISILGYVQGFWAVLLMFTGSVCLMMFEYPVSPRIDYDIVYKTRFHAIFFAVGGLTWGIEFSRAIAYRHMRDFNARLERVSLTDQLTGVLNRRGLQDLFISEVNRFNRTGEPFSMLLVDVDDFKAINDEHGHLVGDEILRELTRLMQDHIRAMDALGRWGGEEFVILLSGTDAQAATPAAEKLRARIAGERGFVKHKQQSITVSIGVTTYHPGTELLQMTDVADHALYTAKQAGKNRVYSLQLSELKNAKATTGEA